MDDPVATASFDDLIPEPTSLSTAEGAFSLTRTTPVVVADDAAGDAAALLGRYVDELLGEAPPLDGDGGGPAVRFTSADGEDDLGSEGYELDVTPERIEVRSNGRAGFLWAAQTLRQALVSAVPEPLDTASPIEVPSVTIRDVPRFEWRGFMLDVARHFFPVEVVESAIDLAASLKLNRFHLHLTDDQGWRLESAAYPELTEVGAQTAVGGGVGGYYTREEYREIVDYAFRRGVIVVPEIDMPGHTQAALASLPWLNCDGTSPPVRTDILVGLSSLCTDDERVYEFADDVIGELADLTTGPYIHIGGDEANQTDPDDYRRFVSRAAAIVRDHGKVPIGWEAIVDAEPGEDAVTQVWIGAEDDVDAIAAAGHGVVMSEASHSYLDMKYEETTPAGQAWAGFIDTERAYSWDPAAQVPAIPASSVIGVEACLWTEFVETPEQVELLILPRLAALAEVAWTAQAERSWDDFRRRVATFGPRWGAAGLTYTRDPGVPWP